MLLVLLVLSLPPQVLFRVMIVRAVMSRMESPVLNVPLASFLPEESNAAFALLVLFPM